MKLLLRPLLALVFSAPAVAEMIDVMCLGAPVACPGAPFNFTGPTSTRKPIEHIRGPETFLYSVEGVRVPSVFFGDIVLCGFGIACGPTKNWQNWSDVVQLKSSRVEEHQTLLADYLTVTDSPIIDLRGFVPSRSAQFIVESHTDGDGKVADDTGATKSGQHGIRSSVYVLESEPPEVPELSSLILMVSGLTVLGRRLRRRRRETD